MYRRTPAEPVRHPHLTAHPTRRVDVVVAHLRDGGVAELRPLRHGEVDVVEAVFTGMSPQSRHQRFLVPMPRLTGGARRTLAAVDGRRHVAWVALVDRRPVGLCRYAHTSPDTAEMAFEVVDEQQGRGIGSALVDAVATVADAHDVTWVEASVTPGNRASVAVLERVGVRLHPEDGLLEGCGRLRLPYPPRVDRAAVLTLAGQASSASRAAATSSSLRSEPCGATS
jgi:RimJ/RimL family protein N-acetyltransferase